MARAHRAELSEDSLDRLSRNPLRILDSKDPRDRPAADSAPDIDAFLTTGAADFFAKVTEGLDAAGVGWTRHARLRSEEHTSELQSLMRISYAVFCLKKKKTTLQASPIQFITIN